MKKTIIIIHEIYGITENLLLLKEKFEMKGFSVFIPSLYKDNYRGVNEQDAYNKFFSEAGIEKGYRIIDSLIAENSDSEIYLIGFSVGAAIAWLHSSNTAIKSVIGIYGSRIRDYMDLKPAVDTYLYFCEEKSFDIKPVINELKNKDKVKITLLNGDHGFYNSSNETDKILKRFVEEEIFRIIG